MLRQLISAVKGAYSGPRAKQHVAALAQFHRLQASPGYRAAAEYCAGQLCSWGIGAAIVSFPADARTTYWGCRMFQEWDASEATLDLILPDGGAERLADYREERIALIQRSLPFEGEAEVVPLEWGGAEKDYEGVEVAGRFVLAQGDIREIHRLAVRERGAIGIIYDGMRDAPPLRQRIDLPDARQYTSFWWRAGEEPQGLGFVLTPRQGDRLRQEARQRRAQGEGLLRVRARVDSRLYDGRIEVVSALIPGRTEQEAVVVAHLCHPQVSANDNASGAAAALEAARTLHALIGSGALPAPERGIRFLWVPEMTGTYAYLATHEEQLARMVAGINLDMVGQNQGLCGSVFIVERPPEGIPSFAGDLAESLRELMQDGATNLAGTATYPLYRHAVTPFSGGSDHYILSDPSVGVPTPMLIQWPDRFYHTSADTLDKVDDAMLAVIGGLATAYAYWVAAAGEAEARWLAGEIGARAKGRLARRTQEGYAEALQAGTAEEVTRVGQRTAQALAFRSERTAEALQALGRLVPELSAVWAHMGDVVREAGEREWSDLRGELERLARALGSAELPRAQQPAPDEWGQRAGQMVLRRLLRGPVGMEDVYPRLGQEERAAARELARAQAMPRLLVHMLYWMDGRRTVQEIAGLVECETGVRDVELMVRLAELMVQAGLLEPMSAP